MTDIHSSAKYWRSIKPRFWPSNEMQTDAAARTWCRSTRIVLLSTVRRELPSNLKAVTRRDFVDLLDTTQLAKFGLNINEEHDTNTLVEKWEALALIPVKEERTPDNYLLLIGSDND